ncbi:TolC family outer membrane protein [Caulobacter sp. 17J65-9]|uniref:TolC family outer membrane protein n=1 Tax=Caulobacter sp. 17J65-9 TaxID=2709382 RepID=UPI0013CD0182|nr:TolC family outer membrane protein [Caulobacter sp. 17J65-9]NEX93941.1 TolC family outer membrane protein [Caulobacter sp. 17J65-9]
MSNRRRALRSAAALSLVLSLSAGAASAETLAEAIGLAYQTNPTLQQQRASLRALDENYVQARSGWRPTADAAVAVTYSDPEFVISSFPLEKERYLSSASLSATQPLYTGGRVASGVSAAEADIMQGRENLRSVEAEVLQAVVAAYADVRRDLAALGIQQENVRVLQRQLEEASARFEVGEITRTDVAQAEARLAAAQANLSAAQANLAVSRASYTSVVGQTPGELAEEPTLPGMPGDFDSAMDAAEQANPALRAAQYAEDAARARVVQAKSQFLPNASLQASVTSQTSVNDFLTNLDQREVRATASISVPLYTGGVNTSVVRQQLERQNAAQIAVQGARRDVLRQVSNAWSLLQSAKAAYVANEEQVRAQRIAAEGVRQENQVGLRTTLDVLNAEQELRTSELALVNARRDQYIAGATLLSAMGRLEAANLVQDVPAYDPKRNFNRVKGKGGVPWEPLIAVVDRTLKPGASDNEKDADAPIDQRLSAKQPSQ